METQFRPHGRRPCRAPSGSVRGTTLIELMFTLSIFAIVSAIAIPSLGKVQRSSARTTAVNGFVHSVYLARSRAIMTNGVVSICRSTNGTTCTTYSSTWEQGWIVFQNIDGDQPANRDAGEPILHRNYGWRGGYITSNRVAFSFRPTSQADVNGTIVFCDSERNSSDARAVIISHTGRPRIASRDASNRALICS